MKHALFTTAAILALLASAIYAFADIARPKPSPKNLLYSGLTITTDAKATEARLVISEETFKIMQQNAGQNVGEASLSDKIIHSSTRTMIAGVFMFLAVSFAGVWFARSGQKRNTKAIAAVILVAIVFGVGTILVRANAGPPGIIRWANLPQNLKDGKETRGGVNIELVPGDDNMKLIIPVRK